MQIRSGMKCALTASVGTMLLLSSSGASANGRFPRGEHIIEYPSDPNRLLLAATYGLVVTENAKDWYYVCESGFSLFPPPAGSDPGYTGDPLLALTADESLLAGVQTRITKSGDRACNWAKSFEDASKTIDDIAVAPSNKNIAVALVRSVTGAMTQVYETTDGGATWGPIGTPLSGIVLGYTIDVDPKDPMHLMVTGITSFDPPPAETGVFLNSTNHGMTWTSSKIPKTNGSQTPYIAGVHPTDGKIVFVRTNEWVDDPTAGASLARDALLYTKDSGMTWTELLRPTGTDGNGAKLFGFAISPDGATVLAGFGDPVEGGGLNVNRDVMGVYKSTGADYSFGTNPTPVYLESATCLHWTAKGIYVCGSPDGATSFIGFASDISKLNAAGLVKIMDVANLKGEPPCCSGRAVTACDWNTDCIRFDACVEGGTSTPPDAGACMMPEPRPEARPEGGAGAGGSAGDAGGTRDASAGSAGMGGAAGGAGGAGTADAATGGKAGSTTGGAGTGGSSTGGAAGSGTGGTGTGGSGGSDDGCGCRVASDARGTTGVTLLLGLIGASGWRRSRRRERRATS